MKIFNSFETAPTFIRFAEQARRDSAQWCFFEVSVSPPHKDLNFEELIQLFQFHVQLDESAILFDQQLKKLILFIHKKFGAGLRSLESSIQDHFDKGAILMHLHSLSNEGVYRLCTFVDDFYEGRLIEILAFKRFKRTTNKILVVDDDRMVLRQMEKILTGYGDVITIDDPSGFNDLYREHVPNIVFLDIHLGTNKGSVLLRELKEDIDPSAQVVMISSDTLEDTVLDVKDGGANGFIVKPPTRHTVFQNLIKAPSFVLKSTHSLNS